jgi:D-ribose pyranase
VNPHEGRRMKKSELINAGISQVIAELGHTDFLVVADAGLPISKKTQRIDLALTNGIPSFIKTVEIVMVEMFIEKAIIAEEMLTYNPDIYLQLMAILGDVPVIKVKHSEFKITTQSSKAIIRTGEFTPYANVILISGAWGFTL